jgi:hypothetical protein
MAKLTQEEKGFLNIAGEFLIADTVKADVEVMILGTKPVP